ncbi:hypothetical protein XBJ1_0398 [Xenorhabdus bovienii SS-2004]|uniref:Uncharacterized protein n=1 Tax=Xenorhabdus bovienii (strain SS-2004) TaxID=406818 RepID=D3UZ20_XENBS|nr:hypothetical protein XBJ1_0398 [Xenorhabdus bovienii SS-2004]
MRPKRLNRYRKHHENHPKFVVSYKTVAYKITNRNSMVNLRS